MLTIKSIHYAQAETYYQCEEGHTHQGEQIRVERVVYSDGSGGYLVPMTNDIRVGFN